MFEESVKGLIGWMGTTSSDPVLTGCVQHYLTSHGEGSMIDIAKGHKSLSAWASHHHTIRWDNFLEGRVSTQFFQLPEKYMRDIHARQNIKSWAVHFISRLLQITHQQWLYRNMRLHIRLVEGKTANEHEVIRQQVVDMLHTKEEDLLPQHQHLLHRDFSALGEGATTDRQYWLADMSSALQAAQSRQTPGK